MDNTLVKIDTLSTLVNRNFNKTATELGFTPQKLASLVLENYTDEFVQEFRSGRSIQSDSPLNEQDCASCRLKESCKDAYNRKELICFEALTVFVAAAIGWLALIKFASRSSPALLAANRRRIELASRSDSARYATEGLMLGVVVVQPHIDSLANDRALS